MTKRIKRKTGDPKGLVRIAIAWYRPWQWERLRELAVDREDIEETYGEWLDVVRQRLPELNRSGIFPVKVDVDVDELAGWCRRRGVPLDAEARAQFVAEKNRRGEYIKE